MPSDNESKLQAEAEREATRLWRAWRTVKEMCLDRVGKPKNLQARHSIKETLRKAQPAGPTWLANA